MVARDAGAAAALAPVVAALDADGVPRKIVAWGNAAAVFAGETLAVRPFPEDPAPSEIGVLLASFPAAAVLTGTSLRADLDGRFWRAADKAGIPSVALLDHWKLYAERFSAERPFDLLPTVVAVMDEVAERALAERGCPSERIRVTGQPRFDSLAALSVPALRREARAQLGVKPSRRVVVFASEPRGLPYDDGTGYTQADALAALLDALAPDALVLVKLHPRERDASVPPGSRQEVRVLRDFPIHSLAAAADIFCGMTSIALLDAALLGVPTLSIRPGDGADHFVDAHPDLIASATTPREIAAALETGLAAGASVPKPPARGEAAGRVCALLDELAQMAGIMRR
ncbi:MAG: CDP-glycerol glycerophosphotransferase family protein [Gaiellaceae bacterium]